MKYINRQTFNCFIACPQWFPLCRESASLTPIENLILARYMQINNLQKSHLDKHGEIGNVHSRLLGIDSQQKLIFKEEGELFENLIKIMIQIFLKKK